MKLLNIQLLAPIAASFSSRGPNPIAVDILKVRHQLPTYLPFSLWFCLNGASHFSNAYIYLTKITAITAPGIDIIAAYSPHASPSGAPGDKRSLKYNILSGEEKLSLI